MHISIMSCYLTKHHQMQSALQHNANSNYWEMQAGNMVSSMKWACCMKLMRYVQPYLPHLTECFIDQLQGDMRLLVPSCADASGQTQHFPVVSSSNKDVCIAFSAGKVRQCFSLFQRQEQGVHVSPECACVPGNISCRWSMLCRTILTSCRPSCAVLVPRKASTAVPPSSQPTCTYMNISKVITKVVKTSLSESAPAHATANGSRPVKKSLLESVPTPQTTAKAQ